MQRELKILVSAYACGPGMGSEPGMGWNYVIGLSKYHQVHVISEEKKFKAPVLSYLKDNPDTNKNLTFYFIRKSRHKFLRKIWPPSYYWYYRRWQKKAWAMAVELDKQEDFDLIHQLNMVGYREPGYLWKISKPFVWGPIGGLENSPWKFLPSLGLKGFVFYSGRNIFNTLQRNFLLRPRRAVNQKRSTVIAATENSALWINKIWHKQAVVIHEVGQEASLANCSAIRDQSNQPFRIVWSGLHTARKNLPLLLKALAKVKFPFKCEILGTGEMTTRWEKLSVRIGIDKSCNWHGWLGRMEALSIMQTGHVFCITSISDLTSTVTLEALSCGLPIICLDHCGFSDVVNEDCGIKIPVTSPSKAAKDFALALERLFSDEEYRSQLSKGALMRAAEFSWDKKIDSLNNVYRSLLEV
ncbi:MAG TPA: glycosyltransferase [Bacteroidales bacterium]|nr:glycosyltransferase [Bacteroidales bacterium]